EVREMLLPLFACLFFLAGFVLYLKDSSGTAPIADAGAWYVVAGTVYLLLPICVYLSLGMVFVPTSDGRVFALQPDQSIVARIAWMYVVHIVAFGLAYATLRGISRTECQPVNRIPRRTLVLSISL